MGSLNIINGGLDVQGIVDQLIFIERDPIRRMQSRTSSLQGKVSAFQSLNTKLSSLLDKVNFLAYGSSTAPFVVPNRFEDRFEESVFGARIAESSDESILTATAGNGIAIGSYEITISSLARAESMASANFADADTTFTGTGKLTITTGTSDPVEITIDTGNNTLSGVRDAINNANAGVTATIINDGSANPYRLLLTADASGTANAFTVSDSLVGGSALSLAQASAASDAVLEVNGVEITKSTNTITDAIGGVTLALKSVTATPVSLSLSRDDDAIVSAVRDFATAYNETNSAINAHSRYNTTTKTAGVLSGDSNLRSIQGRLQAIITQAVSNDHTSYGILSEVGLKFNNDGSIALDETKLRDALSEGVRGVAAVFLGDGTITDQRVRYVGKTEATQLGTYAISVTSLAERASVTGSRAITALTQDESLTISYGGTSTVVSLSEGDTIQDVIDAVNAALGTNQISAVAENGGGDVLRIRTELYGSSQSLTVVSDLADTAGSAGIGATPLSDTGVDIAGTFNGNPALGDGLSLTGGAGKPEEGLKVTIGQTVTGAYGSLTLASGYAGVMGASPLINLQAALDGITDPLDGPLHYSTDSLNDSISDINEKIAEYEERLKIRREILLREFSKADAALRQMSVLQSSLSSQIASLSSF